MENSNVNKRKELFDTILQLFFIFLVVGFCLTLLMPFFMPILWAAILAVAFYPLFNFLQRILKGRKTLAAVIITITIIALMLVPVVYALKAATSNFLELKTEFEVAKLDRERAVTGFRQSVLSASGEVADALVRTRYLDEQQDVANAQVDTLSKAILNAQLLFRSDLAGYLEVITAQANKLDAELNLAYIQRQRLSARVELYRALGGGWK